MKHTAIEFTTAKKRGLKNICLFCTFTCSLLFYGIAQADATKSAGAGDDLAGRHILLAKAEQGAKGAKPSRTERREEPQLKKQPPDLTVATRSLAHKDARCSVMVNYPQVGNEKIDAELDFWANKTVSTFVSGVQNSPARVATATACLWITSDRGLGQVPEHRLSHYHRYGRELRFRHGTFTYDRSDGRNLGMRDIFGDASGLLHFISLYSYEALTAELGSGYESKIRQGTSPDFLNFSLFSIDSDGMVLYFPPYQVADYTLGEKKVRIEARKLKPYMPRTDLWGGSGTFGSNNLHLDRPFDLAPQSQENLEGARQGMSIQ